MSSHPKLIHTDWRLWTLSKSANWGLVLHYSKLDQDVRIAWLLVLPSSPLGPEISIKCSIASSTKYQERIALSETLKHPQLGLSTQADSSSRQTRRGALLHNNQGETRWEGVWALSCTVAWTWKTFCAEGGGSLASVKHQAILDPGSEEGGLWV